MAYAQDSLDPSICCHLREVESRLVQIADTSILSEVLIEHRLLTEDDREDIDKVTVFFYFLVLCLDIRIIVITVNYS